MEHLHWRHQQGGGGVTHFCDAIYKWWVKQPFLHDMGVGFGLNLGDINNEWSLSRLFNNITRNLGLNHILKHRFNKSTNNFKF